jgi:hypothetical protein
MKFTKNLFLSCSQAITKMQSSRFFLFSFLVIFILATRLPLLNAGYGNEPDAWRVAYVAQQIATSGKYFMSRTPGHPVQEITSSFVWQGGPFALNFLSTFLSGLAAVFFFLIAKILNIKDRILATIAFVMIPILYINSTQSTDFIWSLAFLLGSLYFAFTKKPVLSGILIGLAVGARLTYLPMIIPLGYIFFVKNNSNKDLFKLITVSMLISVICYSPVFFSYGIKFLSFDDDQLFVNSQTWSMKFILWAGTIGVWGRLGSVGIFVSMIGLFHYLFLQIPKIKKIDVAHSLIHNPILAVYGYSLLVYIVMFVIFPYKPAYLMPILPFIVLIIYQYLSRGLYIFVTALIVLSNFLSISESGLQPGVIIVDQNTRLLLMDFADHIKTKVNDMPPKSIFIAGDWLPKLRTQMPWQSEDEGVQYVFMLSEESENKLKEGYRTFLFKFSDMQESDRLIKEGYRIYYLPGQKVYAKNEDDRNVFPLLAESIDESVNIFKATYNQSNN